MTIVGSTINPTVGFILPIVFYWKVKKDTPLLSCTKISAIIVAVVIVIVSVLSLVNFFMGLFEDDSQ